MKLKNTKKEKLVCGLVPSLKNRERECEEIFEAEGQLNKPEYKAYFW